MEPTGRMFLCAGCRALVVVCPRCDRGQIYCSRDCAARARRASQRAAGRRYQASRRGRFAHAARARRYRARRNIVTHQGSDGAPTAVHLRAGEAGGSRREAWRRRASPTRRHARLDDASSCSCDLCGRGVGAFARLDFLATPLAAEVDAVIGPELEAEILRLTTPRSGRSARSRASSASTTRRSQRVLAQAGCRARPRRRGLDRSIPTCPSSCETLEQLPDADGRAGSTRWCASAATAAAPDHFRHLVALLRPRPDGRGVPAAAHAARRAGAGRLGALRPGHDRHARRRPLMAFVMVLSLLARDLPALLPRTRAWRTSCAATSRRSPPSAACARVAALRQPQERRARARRRRDPLPPDAARARGALPLRAAAGGASARGQREGTRRARDPLRPRLLLRGARVAATSTI